MNKLNANQASDKILKIAKIVAEMQGANQQLTQEEEKRVSDVVAKIIANTDVDESVLQKINQIED